MGHLLENRDGECCRLIKGANVSVCYRRNIWADILFYNVGGRQVHNFGRVF
jgi:hypothetical protein